MKSALSPNNGLLLLSVAIACLVSPSACAASKVGKTAPISARAQARSKADDTLGVSCAPAVVMKTDQSSIRLELWQTGRRIPVCDGVWRLHAAPFVFRLRGHVSEVSYRLTTLRKETRILETMERPLVTSGGHALAITGMELQHRYRLMKAPLVSVRWFETAWYGDSYGKSPRGSDDYYHWLKRTVGLAPRYADFGRVYFPTTTRSQEKVYYLDKLKKLPGGQGIAGEFPVRQIDSKPVASFRDLRMTVFLQRDLGRASFTQLLWRFVDLKLRPVR